MEIRPLTLRQANEMIASLHRHHKPVRGHRFSIGAYVDGELVGVAVIGRPVARLTDAGSVAEVTRVATNGTRNACSALLGAAARAAKAMGFTTIQTFTLQEETGASLRGAGWDRVHVTRPSGAGWQSRQGRRTDQPTGPKVKWEKVLNPAHSIKD